jgi:phosphate acetyltransferase
MNILETLRQRAAGNPQHIVLPEGNDPRTVVAAAICTRQNIARITLLGDEAIIRETAERERADMGGVTVIDHKRAADFEKLANTFHELRRAKGLMADEARTMLADPLYYGNLMVRLGAADGSVAGATNTTSHTVRAALLCIGVRSGFKLVSSFFLMSLRDSGFGHDGAMIYADCGVVIEPTAAELAEIAHATSRHAFVLDEGERQASPGR